MEWDKEIETQLDTLNSIQILPKPQECVSLENAHGVFVTGATGYLGAFLLKELCLKNIPKIYCLVRASSKEAGKIRISENMKKYELWESSFEERIKVVIGDLTQVNLGINNDEYLSLASSVNIVFHLGAVVNYAVPYSSIATTTVLGTSEIIKFCCLFSLKPLHFISTNAVFPLIPPPGVSLHCEEKVLAEKKEEGRERHPCGELADGYSQSKYVAETLVTRANHSFNLPCVIYRPGWIGFSFSNGASNPLDLLAWMVGLGLFVEAGPIRGEGCEKWRLESFPVDILAKVITGTENISAGDGPPASVYEELHRSGHIKQLVSQQEWRLQISQKEKELVAADQNGKPGFPKAALEELKSFLPMLDEYAHWYDQEGVKQVLKKIGLPYPEMTPKTFLKQVDFLKKGTVIQLCGLCGY